MIENTKPEAGMSACNDLLGKPKPLTVGMRIRFTKTLISGPSGDAPAHLYAQAGDCGEITGHGAPEGYWVKWDGWPHPFGASCDEFEPLPPNASLQPTPKRSVGGRLEGIVGRDGGGEK